MPDAPLFICGAPRSGTSLTALAFEACGIWAGKTTRLGENTAIKNKVLKPMLRAGGMDERALTSFVDVGAGPRWIRNTVLGVLEQQGYQGGPWLFKDVKLVFCWRSWAEAFPEAVWATVWRSPPDILDSFDRWDLTKPEGFDGPRIITEHHRRALRIPGPRLHPSRMIAGDVELYRAVCERMGIEWNAEAVAAVVSPENFHAAA